MPSRHVKSQNDLGKKWGIKGGTHQSSTSSPLRTRRQCFQTGVTENGYLGHTPSSNAPRSFAESEYWHALWPMSDPQPKGSPMIPNTTGPLPGLKGQAKQFKEREVAISTHREQLDVVQKPEEKSKRESEKREHER